MFARVTVGVAACLLGLVTAASVAAQGPHRWRGAGGWGPGTGYGRLYDTKTVETLRGEVIAVERFTPEKAMSAGIHLRLKTDKETLPIHLGPEWYIERQEVEIKVKDVVEVTGARVTFDGKPAIIAAEVRKGDDTLVLRDASGFPAWSAWRRR